MRKAIMQRKTKTVDLFDFFVRIDSKKCWNWTGKRDPRFGYGAVERKWNGKRYVLVHRLAYAVLVGDIPDGYTIDHLCRNRACCNPKHLEAVTLEENLRRRLFKTKCGRGHTYDEVGFKKGQGLYPRCSKCNSKRKGKR